MARLAKRPLQVYLDPNQERVARAVAQRERISLAELVRRSLDSYLSDLVPPEADPSLGIIGLGHSGRPDLAENHDEVVGDQAAMRSDGE
jgi:hypothetical protein